MASKEPNMSDQTPKGNKPFDGYPNSLASLCNTETVVPPPSRVIIKTLLDALPSFGHPNIVYTPGPPRSESKIKYRDPEGTSLIVLTTANPALNDLLRSWFHSIYVRSTGRPENAFQPREPGQEYRPILRILKGTHHDRNNPPSDNSAVPTPSSRISGAGNQSYQLATGLHGTHNRIASYGNLLTLYAKVRAPGGVFMSRYKTVIFVSVQSFVQLPPEFERINRDGGWRGKWDGQYRRDDPPEKRLVNYSVIMMYNVNKRQTKVVVTKGVTVNAAWVRKVMWMCGFEDNDAEPWMMPEANDKDRKGMGTKVKGRKPVGEEMKTSVWNGTTEHLDPGDWQKVAAGWSRYELIREALERFREGVKEWLT